MRLFFFFLLVSIWGCFNGSSDSFSGDLTIAKSYQDDENWAGAIAIFDSLITLYPKNAQLYFQRGCSKEMALMHEESIMDFDAAIMINPKMKSLRTNRGFANRNLGNYEKAIEDFSAEIKLYPSSSSYEHRAYVYYLVKDYEKALKDLNRSIALDPANSISFKSRAMTHIALGNVDEGCEDAYHAVKLKIKTKFPRYNNHMEQIERICAK